VRRRNLKDSLEEHRTLGKDRRLLARGAQVACCCSRSGDEEQTRVTSSIMSGGEEEKDQCEDTELAPVINLATYAG